MQAQVSEISPVLVQVKVEVPWETVQKDLDDASKRIAKTAHVKGFRPGKAPTKVVKQVYGRAIRGEVAGQLIEQGLMKAVEEHSLQIVARPQVAPSDIEEGQAFTFTAEVEIRPSIDEVKLEGLDLYREKHQVKDEDVEAELAKIRREQADIRVPDPMRPAKEGDVVKISYHVDLDGERREELSSGEKTVELGTGKLIPEIEKALLGAEPAAHVHAETKMADDHANESIRGKTALFHIHVHEIHEVLLPELDDELAKDVGDHETLDALRADIRSKLESMAERQIEAQLNDQLIEKLVELNAIPVPPSMVKEQHQMMLYELFQMMQVMGPGGFDPALFEGVNERAERRVRAGLLLGALARIQGIEVKDEEIDARFQKMAEESGKHVAKVRAEHQGEKRDRLASSMLQEKLMDFLRQKATIHEEPPPKIEEKAAEAG